MSNLDGLSFYGDHTLTSTLLHNVMGFMQYGLLEIGAFTNVPSGEDVLSRVTAPGVPENTTFVGKKHDWIWESDVDLKYDGGSQPTVPSGIFVDNVFYPTGTSISGTGYFIDFSKGQVVFDNPIPTGTEVRAPHAYRHVQIYRLEDYQYRNIERAWIQSSGNTTTQEVRAYLPAIFIGLPNFQTQRGTHLGSRAKNIWARLEFQIVADNPHERDKIKDLIYMMETKTFKLYDLNRAEMPLNYRGELVNPTHDWQYLVQNFGFNGFSSARFAEDFNSANIGGVVAPLFRGRCNLSLEADVAPF